MRWLILTVLLLCCVETSTVRANPSLDELREKAEKDPSVAIILAEQLIAQNTDENGDEILKWCKFAANKGALRGKYLLGRCYSEGWGTRKNLRQGFAFYKQAAADGDPEALNAVGLCYMNGIGTRSNELEAYAAFVESALLNNRDAKFNLGKVYEKGLGVEKNLKTATYWYGQAADQGQKEAIARLAEITPDSTAPAKNETPQTPPSPAMAKTNSITTSPDAPHLTPSSPSQEIPQPQIVSEENNFRLVLPKWIIWGSALALLISGTSWGAWLWWKNHSHTKEDRPQANQASNSPKTFSCIQCGQLLLVPSYTARKLLECPSCHSDYEVWKDKNGILHLQNRDSQSGMKTYISFGEEESMQSPYSVLGIPENCTLDEARDAFRKRMKEYHPDRVMNLGQELRELAALKAREINEAYNLVVQQKQI